jgi:RNA recognition motif-containing protein
MSGHQVVKGYRVLSVPIGNDASVYHLLYIKEHNDKSHKGSTLFVGNIDCVPEMSQETVDTFLRCMFDGFGEIESISLSELGRNMVDKSRFAHVNYTKKTAVKLALNAKTEDYAELANRATRAIGISGERKKLNRSQIRGMFPLFDINPRKLQDDVDSFMIEFDAEEKLKEDEEDLRANVPDEDGFVVVRRYRFFLPHKCE